MLSGTVPTNTQNSSSWVAVSASTRVAQTQPALAYTALSEAALGWWRGVCF